MSEKILCIYHANCADGFTAAWAVWKALGESAEYHPGQYGIDPPDVTGRDVVIVDFSYKRPVLEAMIAQAASLLILDHHKTAAEDLAGLPAARDDWAMHYGYLGAPGVGSVGAVFDMNRSGAGITWDFFHPKEPRPKMVDYVEDRDLWRFNLPGSREIAAFLFSYEYEMEIWDEASRFIEHAQPEAERAGASIERKHHKDIAELLTSVRRRMVIGGFDVPVANLPYTMSSDAGNVLARGEPFGACYVDTPHGRSFSLRSTDAGEDVSAIAKQYGGGGHRNASGFRMPIGWEGDAKEPA